MTKRFVVAGSPIAHSRSPVMHEAAFRALGIDASYGLRVAEITDVPALIAELRGGTWDGCNITTPLKTEVARHCSCDAMSAKAGAVNTIWLSGGVLKGALTDVDGICEPLRQRGLAGAAPPAMVLGAGGAARAAALALASMGARVSVAARDVGKAKEVLALVDGDARGEALPLASLSTPRALAGVGVLVQATSLGRGGESLDLAWEGVQLTAFEMLYAPRVTPFLASALAAGCTIIEGWEMLLAQGARSFELWLGVEAPRAVMRDALLASLS